MIAESVDYYRHEMNWRILSGLWDSRRARRCFELPAKRAGIKIDRALVSEIIADVVEQPGALPMLQYALTELFEERHSSKITKQSYQAIGGVLGALGGRAEKLFESLDKEGQETARQMFLRLVTLGEGTEDTRRRVMQTELEGIVEDREQVRAVIDAFGKARLLTFDRDPISHNPTVEVAHEALIREWARFREWLEASRTNVSMQRRLAAAGNEWKFSKEDASFLLRGARLEQFESWAGDTDIALSKDERKYLEESTAAKTIREAEETERQVREAALEKRSRTILRTLVAVFAVAGVVSVFLANFAFGQQRQAEANAVIADSNALLADTAAALAEQQAKLALSRELAAHAINLLDSDPELSILLAMQALSEVYTREADSALHAALGASRIGLTIPGNGSALAAVAVSPDGTMFATAGDEPFVNVWDTNSGELLMTFPGGRAPFLDVAFHPDGEVLMAISPGPDNTIWLWDLASREEINFGDQYQDTRYTIFSFSADGVLLGFASQFGDTYLVELIDDYFFLERAAVLSNIGSESPFTGIVFSPDGSQLAISEANGRVRIRSTTSINLPIITELPRVCDWADGLAYNPNGRMLAVGCEGKIVLWDVTNAETITIIEEFGRVYSISFDRFGTRLVTATNTGIRVWDLLTFELLYELQGHKGIVNEVVFTPDGTQIISVGSDGAAKVWNATTVESGSILAFSDTTPFVEGDVGNCRGIGVVEVCPQTAYSHIAISSDGARLASGIAGGVFEIRDIDSGDLLHAVDLNPSSMNNSAFSFDGTMVASAWGDNIVRIYDPTSGELLHTLEGHRAVNTYPFLSDGIQDVAFNQDNSLLASAGLDGRVVIWDPVTGEQVDSLREHLSAVTSVEFSPEGKLLASTSVIPFAKVIVWDTTTWEVAMMIEEDGSLFGLAFSPDGSRLATSGVNGIITIRDAADGQTLLEFIGHAGDVVDIVFSPDGQLIATASSSGEAKIWDAVSGQEVFSFLSSNAAATGVAFHPDGQSLLVSLANGRIVLHRLDIAYFLAQAQGRETRGLTTEECRAYLHVEECPG